MSLYDALIEENIRAIESLDQSAVKRLVEHIKITAKNGNSIWVLGNGGSATTAAHFSTDLSKGVFVRTNNQYRAICLNELLGIQTAWSNDFGFNTSLKNSLESFCRTGDLVIVISGSGNSENLIELGKAKDKNGWKLFGLLGMSGGKLLGYCDDFVLVNSQNMQVIENVHVLVTHLVFSDLSRVGN